MSNNCLEYFNYLNSNKFYQNKILNLLINYEITYLFDF